MVPSVMPGPLVFVAVPFTVMVMPAQGSGGAMVPFLLQEIKNEQNAKTQKHEYIFIFVC